MGNNSGQTTEDRDERVLADPGAFAADKVLEVLARSTPEQVAAAKSNEEGGKARKTVLEWAPDPADAPEPDAEPLFPRERLLGPEGPAITGHDTPTLVGALHDDTTAEFTRAQIDEKVKAFLERPVSQED